MQHVEALREVKRAEAEVKLLREQAAKQAAEELRGAERRATEAIEKAKADAEAEYGAALKAAQDAVAKDRQKAVAKGEAEAQAVRGRQSSAEFNRAVDLVLANFEKRVAGARK